MLYVPGLRFAEKSFSKDCWVALKWVWRVQPRGGAERHSLSSWPEASIECPVRRVKWAIISRLVRKEARAPWFWPLTGPDRCSKALVSQASSDWVCACYSDLGLCCESRWALSRVLVRLGQAVVGFRGGCCGRLKAPSTWVCLLSVRAPLSSGRPSSRTECVPGAVIFVTS